MARHLKHGALASVWLLLASCAELPPHARQQILDAEREYRLNDLDDAQPKLDAVLRDFPDHAESAEAYYLRGLCHLRSGRTSEARSDFHRCINLSTRSDLTARASAALGGLQHDAGQLGEAAESFERALRDLPEVPPADQVRHRYGICLQRLGRWEEARSLFASVMHQYPRSDYVEDARRRFSWNQRFFAIQCGAFVSESEAAALVGRLKAAFPDARKEPEARFGRPMFVVYVGRYPTYAEAQRGLPEVRSKAPGAFVVP